MSASAARFVVNRNLSRDEIEFLSWFFVASARAPYGEGGDWPDGLAMKTEWEERAGRVLPDDFLSLVVQIHDSQ